MCTDIDDSGLLGIIKSVLKEVVFLFKNLYLLRNWLNLRYIYMSYVLLVTYFFVCVTKYLSIKHNFFLLVSYYLFEKK